MTYLATTISAFATALATILVDHALDNGEHPSSFLLLGRVSRARVGRRLAYLERQRFIAATAQDIWCDAGAYLATEDGLSRLAPPAAIVRDFFKVETLGAAPGNSIVLLKAMNECFKVHREQAEQEAKSLPTVS